MRKNLSYFPTLRLQSLAIVAGVTLMAILTGCEGKKESSGSHRQPGNNEATALSHIRKSDCLNCHSINDKSVGPSYQQIAQRYEADETTVNTLADKIIEGGGGLWGGAVMTKHPYLKKPDAVKIVRWILSLDDSTANRDPMAHAKGILLAKAFKEHADGQSTKNGLMLKAYSLKSFGDYRPPFPDVSEDIKPVHSGLVKQIHLPTSQSFKPLSKDFVLQATGFIHIDTPGKYFFKQVRTGKGRLFIDGEKKINENAWDSEVVVDLSPGVYPIQVDYQSGDGDETLSLQWITPDGEYYQVIPEEVFTYN